MSSAATATGSSAATVGTPQLNDTRVKTALEGGVKFQIKAGNNKWQCTILDRATHERQKAARTNSTTSMSSVDSK